MKIKIEWLTDSYDCDDCGPSWADGAKVYFDDKLEINLVPSASCFGGDNYDRDAVYEEIFKRLGHSLDTDY